MKNVRKKLKKHSSRMRGGQPFAEERMKQRKVFSPHARGSTQCFNDAWFIAIILPACAGVNPGHKVYSRVSYSPPHTRGSTPHPQSFRRGYRILPACAGVSLISVVGKAKILNSPRMRGGQPAFFMKKLAEAQFSPHVRGSNHETDTVNSDGMIHPACAGVNPPTDRLLCSYAHSPRMRGDQPR